MAFPAYPLPENWLFYVASYHAYAYGGELDTPYNYTGDTSAGNEGAWNSVNWSGEARTKPTFAELEALQQEAFSSLGSYWATYYQFADHALLGALDGKVAALEAWRAETKIVQQERYEETSHASTGVVTLSFGQTFPDASKLKIEVEATNNSGTVAWSFNLLTLTQTGCTLQLFKSKPVVLATQPVEPLTSQDVRITVTEYA